MAGTTFEAKTPPGETAVELSYWVPCISVAPEMSKISTDLDERKQQGLAITGIGASLGSLVVALARIVAISVTVTRQYQELLPIQVMNIALSEGLLLLGLRQGNYPFAREFGGSFLDVVFEETGVATLCLNVNSGKYEARNLA